MPLTLVLSRKGRITAATVATVAVAALSLSGCSSSSGTSAGGKEVTSVTVLRSTGSTFEPLFIAQEKGYFKAAGLKVTIKLGAADTSANVPSVVNDEAQFGMTDSSGLVKSIAAGLPVVAVGQLQASDSSTAPTDGLIVKSDSSIKSYKDLDGKTVGLPSLGGTVQMAVDYFVEKDGGDPTTVKFVALPITSLNQSVSSGQVDAGYTFTPFYDAAKASGLTSIGNGTNDINGLPQGLLFATSKFVAANPTTTDKFVKAIGKAITFANANPDAVRDVDKKYTDETAAVIAARKIAPFNVSFNKEAMSIVVDTMSQFKLIPKKPTDVIWSGAPTTSN